MTTTTELSIERHFTREGEDPYSTVEWELRDAKVGSGFEQKNVEFPAPWSQTATNIVAQKYFRGRIGTPEREWSLKQLIGRVVGQITKWGIEFGYFDKEAARVFSDELTYISLHQYAAFNSPVQFNIGAEGRKQTPSACFILDLQDNMESIKEWIATEADIFRVGSGSGVNVSRLREDGAPLSRGGTSSGPISFMRWADSGAGAIKSGGNSRRAAKLIAMDIDHPDIEEFIECKAREERKIRALRAAGFEVDFDGRDTHTLGFQNANNSVRVSDEFLHAVEDDEDWNLISRWDGRVTKTVKARELMRKIAEAAWACADPGLQFDTTINNWNTTPNMGRLEASNPCFTGDTMVSTDKGDVMFRDLLVAMEAGEDVLVWSYGVSGAELCKPSAVMVTGVNKLIYIELSNGLLPLKCTPSHKIMTNNRGWIEAQNLRSDDQVVTLREEDGKWEEELAYVVKKSRPTVRETTYDLTEPKNHSFIANGVVVHNCAEHIRRNNSSCNLASINLMKFLHDNGTFNITAFRQVVRVVYTAMDIMISGGEFPTDKITQVTCQDRDLGLGYCNLGALLMAQGLPYDSDEGRAWAAGITSLMTGLAYERSTELAEMLGPHPTFEVEAGKRIMHMHAKASGEIDTTGGVRDVVHYAQDTWRNVFERTEQVGLRNAQASIIAPTGTISFLMDATTTGMEPEFALVKVKKLVGGGTIATTNPMVGRGLKALGYEENDIAEILAYVNKHSTVINAPGLDPDYYPVFATSMGDNSIAAMGHVKMMAAIQPGLAGSMSKTVNLPSTATVDDVYETYMEAWRRGIKCIALYVEGSKVAEPMTATKKASEVAQAAPTPTRRRLPRKRPSDTTSFRIKDPTGSIACEGYMNAGRYPNDDTLGEIFVKVSKQGSTLAGVMDAFAIAVSLGLQYGVPLDVFVSKFVNMRFEPSGGVDDPDFLGVTSIMDYLFRALARDYLSLDDRQELNVLTISDRKALGKDMVQAGNNGHEKVEEIKTTSASSVDAPLCYSCGVKMQRAGTCYVCESCGSTSGCS